MIYNVMLIDDEEWSLKSSKALFHWEEYGFNVVYTTTEQLDALEYLENEKVHVILLDMLMAGYSGEQMMREIRKRNKEVEIVVLSAHPKFSYAQAAIEYNVFSYCLKPISERKGIQLLEKLKEALDRKYPQDEALTSRPEIENYKFDKLIAYIDQHFYKKLYLNELADKFGLNFSYCCSLFKKHFNMNFKEYVTELRMKKATELLKTTDMDIDEIADYLSYEYVYFCKLFKKRFEVTPRQFRVSAMKKRD